ncbi:transposase [Coprococcus comes]|uniref:transposase n=1 Tax=Coprococcus comes TaxID=410072 RepID=UPI003A7F230A
MASSKEYLQFILEQLSDLEEINYRAMMGEYIICKNCPYKKECIKGNNCKTPIEERNKVLSVAKTFLKYREEDLERILSDEGILLRINRSIQAEGSFGELKQDMQFRRYLSRGTSNVLAESILLAMAKNVNKLHNKIQKGKMGRHLFPLKSA